MDAVVSAKIPNHIVMQLEKIAKSYNKKRGVIVREIVEQFVKQWAEEDTLKKTELASWEEYLETGLHVTGDEMDAWLATWGTDKETPPPQCHL